MDRETPDWLHGISGIDELDAALRRATSERQPIESLPEHSAVRRLHQHYENRLAEARENQTRPTHADRTFGRLEGVRLQRTLSIIHQFVSLTSQLVEAGAQTDDAIEMTRGMLRAQALLSRNSADSLAFPVLDEVAEAYRLDLRNPGGEAGTSASA